MGKKSKSKSKSKSTEATTEPAPAVKNETAEDIIDQSNYLFPPDLADTFAKSAAFFGKKASYTSVVAEGVKSIETNVDEIKKETKVDKKKETKVDKKKKKKVTQLSKATEEDKQEQEDKKETEDEEAHAKDGKTKKEKKKKKKEKKNEVADKEKESAPEDEKEHRTVFVGNVSLDATPKNIKKHFAVCGKVEHVRLRHLPIAGCAVDQAGNQKLMMKVCANKKILTTARDNCNAYVTFVEKSSVEAALKLNGTTLVEKKIRVDRSQPVIDARRSIFLGNVPFKCTDDQMMQFFAKRLKTEEEPEPIENVRLIRDRESGLGKGFGYLLLKTPALAAKTLALRDLKMETRELRVQVCGKRFKNLRGGESSNDKFEGLRSSAGARARIQLKRKVGAEDLERALPTKKIKRAALSAGLGKKLKPKHAARKAAKAAAEASAAVSGKSSDKRKHHLSDSKMEAKSKAKKPKHAARKARQTAVKE